MREWVLRTYASDGMRGDRVDVRRPFALEREPKRHALAWAGELHGTRPHQVSAGKRACAIENADGCRFTTPLVSGFSKGNLCGFSYCKNINQSIGGKHCYSMLNHVSVVSTCLGVRTIHLHMMGDGVGMVQWSVSALHDVKAVQVVLDKLQQMVQSLLLRLEMLAYVISTMRKR